VAVERLGALLVVLARAEQVELLGEHDELRPVRGSGPRQLVGCCEVAFLVLIRVELNGRGAHAQLPSQS